MYEFTEDDTDYVDGDYPALQRKHCVSCGAKIYQRNERWNPHTQDVMVDVEADNALFIDITGGYAQFIDGVAYTVLLCHECSHDLCDQIPWLNKLLNPALSHSHKTEYKKAHPDHYGWDYDVDKTRGHS